MPFVIDTSVTLCWAFDDEDHPAAASALLRLGADSARAPSLWWFEVRNALVVNERRGRITEAGTASFLRLLSRLDISIDDSPEEAAVLAFARRHRLTVYDAAYLELARRGQMPLATLDGDLIRAAQAEGVTPLPTAVSPPSSGRA